MEVEVELQQMLKNVTGDLTNSLLSDFGEDGISELLKQSGPYSGCAIYGLSVKPCHRQFRGSLHATIIAPATLAAVPPT